MAAARSISVVRDHLANERTFLAWLRGGLSAMAVGVIALLARLRPSAPIAAVMLQATALRRPEARQDRLWEARSIQRRRERLTDIRYKMASSSGKRSLRAG